MKLLAVGAVTGGAQDALMEVGCLTPQTDAAFPFFPLFFFPLFSKHSTLFAGASPCPDMACAGKGAAS